MVHITTVTYQEYQEYKILQVLEFVQAARQNNYQTKILHFVNIFATTQLNSTQSWVGLIFLRNHTTTANHRNRPSLFSQLLDNQTRPNSVCNLISTQLEDSCKKNWVQFSKFDFEPILN